MRRALPFLSCLLFVLCLCRHASALPALPHEAYIWQRQWTPALFDAIDEARSVFAGYRVLVAESDRSGALQMLSPDLATLLKQEQVPVTAVIRLNGSDPPAAAALLTTRISVLVRDWQANGLQLAGIEIDYNCATARLADYAQLLRDLRRAGWPNGLRLSITALPTWIGARALPNVIEQADESVLQVHAVRNPASGLFDAGAARRWVDAYAVISTQPFRVSVPAYGVRVQFDGSGKARAVEAEMPRDIAAGADTRELRARPQDVAELLHGLAGARPPQLVGVVWFRLPTQDDRRAWSIATLRAVITAAPLVARPDAFAQTAADGASDIVLANRGTLDVAYAAVAVQADRCSAGDAVSGYRLQQDAGIWHFAAPADAILRAGRERRIGWLRCGIVEKVNIDETP